MLVGLGLGLFVVYASGASHSIRPGSSFKGSIRSAADDGDVLIAQLDAANTTATKVLFEVVQRLMGKEWGVFLLPGWNVVFFPANYACHSYTTYISMYKHCPKHVGQTVCSFGTCPALSRLRASCLWQVGYMICRVSVPMQSSILVCHWLWPL